MRWLHESVDHLHVSLVRGMMPRVFRDGIDSPSLAEHLAAVNLTLPPLTSGQRTSLSVDTLVGTLEAGFQVRLGPRPDLPVVLYHHGIAEFPYDKSFRGIFRTPLNAHLVVVRAPFHRTWFDLVSGLATASNLLALCAVAVKLGEALRLRLLTQGARGSLVTGSSLGGFLTLVHHLTYGTADGYVPLLAGPDMAHVLLCTHYRRLLAPQALAQAAQIRALLDVRQALQASATSRILPLLARYDRGMLYAHQSAGYAASGIPVVTLARGHLTGAVSFRALRAHLAACLQALAPGLAGQRPS